MQSSLLASNFSLQLKGVAGIVLKPYEEAALEVLKHATGNMGKKISQSVSKISFFFFF